jgi:HSP20 family molecular chaperone IbpA
MAITRRRSFSDMVDEYFRDVKKWAEQFEATTTEKPSWNLRNCSIEPLREITMTPREVLVTVDLPFTNKGAVKVKPVGSSALEVSAKMKRKIRLDDLGVTYCKGEFQKFQCHLRIPVPVKMDRMDVRYKKGMLEIHLPRRY